MLVFLRSGENKLMKVFNALKPGSSDKKLAVVPIKNGLGPQVIL